MVERLDEETQAKVDAIWANMFKPPDRLDRELLLDVILVRELHQFGVDYLRLLCEKRAGDGLVVMEVRFDRENPAFDEFSITYVDSTGCEVRRERFTREEVQEQIDLLFRPIIVSADGDPELRAQQEQRVARQEARHKEIHAVLAPLCEQEQGPAEDAREPK